MDHDVLRFRFECGVLGLPIEQDRKILLHSAAADADLHQNRPDREQARITSLRSRQSEGLIIATALLEHPLLRQLHEQRGPMVLAGQTAPGYVRA
ncbi:hypothetical protein ACW2Q0_19895 [Nocardia sp. R16R-3T]